MRKNMFPHSADLQEEPTSRRHEAAVHEIGGTDSARLQRKRGLLLRMPSAHYASRSRREHTFASPFVRFLSPTIRCLNFLPQSLSLTLVPLVTVSDLLFTGLLMDESWKTDPRGFS